MVKTNEDAGFGRIHEISEGVGDAGSSLTANLQVGKSDQHADATGGGSYRAYAYLYHHEQDASREGIRDSLCARGSTAVEAMAEIQRRADDQWSDEQARGLRRAAMEVQESLAEDGERVC